MKELTKKQKLDFILYCMEKIDESNSYFHTCVNLRKFLNISYLSSSDCAEAFPELLKFSMYDNNEVGYFILDKSVTPNSENATRAIIYSFLYNELTGEIKI